MDTDGKICDGLEARRFCKKAHAPVNQFVSGFSGTLKLSSPPPVDKTMTGTLAPRVEGGHQASSLDIIHWEVLRDALRYRCGLYCREVCFHAVMSLRHGSVVHVVAVYSNVAQWLRAM